MGIRKARALESMIPVLVSREQFSFLKWQQDQLKLEALGKPGTWEVYRRKLKVLNQNKLIVFADDYFGIFPSHEVSCWQMFPSAMLKAHF